MSVSVEELQSIPLFHDITAEHMTELVAAFESFDLAAGDVLFEAGSQPTALYLLVDGEISLREGTDIQYHLHPPAPIGELGAVTGYIRNTTAVATKPSRLLKMRRQDLIDFFESHGDVAFPFYHNLVNVVAEKVRRDSRRLEEMRANLIHTQKEMKRMRDLVMEADDSPTTADLYETLDGLIRRNRRSNYVVEPPNSLPAHVRLNDGSQLAVRELSAVWLVLPATAELKAEQGNHWSGVLVTRRYEIPVSGEIMMEGPDLIKVELDLLIDEFADQLEDYLTRVQMLDVVV